MESIESEMSKENCQQQDLESEKEKTDSEMCAYKQSNLLLSDHKSLLIVESGESHMEKENYQPLTTDPQYNLPTENDKIEEKIDTEKCAYKYSEKYSELLPDPYKVTMEMINRELEMDKKSYQSSTVSPLHELVSEKEENISEMCAFKQISHPSSDPSVSLKINRSNRKKRSNSGKTFYCAKCSYSANYKSALVSHMMSHRDPSETTMYKCDFCGHETKRKADLRTHLIIHKDPAEVKLFYCANCPYTTKRKCDLKQHVIIHLTTPYKCPHCNFETRNKLYLDRQHMLLHRDESEIEVYKCELCLYETKIKYNLKSHYRNMHQSDNAKKYECNWCDFKTKHKINLRDHMLIHTCTSQLEMFECYTCGFQTKRKSGIKDHIWAQHMVVEEKYQCAHCPFKTRVRSSIRAHLVLHRDPSKIRYYHCNVCDYKAIRKATTKNHMQTHLKTSTKGRVAPAATKIESIDQLNSFDGNE